MLCHSIDCKYIIIFTDLRELVSQSLLPLCLYYNIKTKWVIQRGNREERNKKEENKGTHRKTLFFPLYLLAGLAREQLASILII